MGLILSALGLGGCVYEERLTVSGPPESPVVTIAAAHRGFLSAPVLGLDYLIVQDLNLARTETQSIGEGPKALQDLNGGHQRTLAWSITRDASCASDIGRVQYGVLPLGFRQLTPPHALLPGHTYSVMIGGCGLIGAGTFRIVGDRIRFAARGHTLNQDGQSDP